MQDQKDMSNLPYDPQWPDIFERIKIILSGKLAGLIEGIEHVGSTSVPGLSAKPRLDIDIVIARPELLPAITEKLRELGYYPQGDLGRAGREAFGRLDETVPYDGRGTIWMKQNLYVCLAHSQIVNEHLRFRDYLRAHPDVAHQYADLKNELAEKYRHDQAAYVAGKSKFIQKTLKQNNFLD